MLMNYFLIFSDSQSSTVVLSVKLQNSSFILEVDNLIHAQTIFFQVVTAPEGIFFSKYS